MFKKIFKKWKRIAKSELTEVQVELVSLLFDDKKPANGKTYTYKSTDGKTIKAVSKSTTTKIKKDEAKGLVYVTIMEPGVTDSQGDSYSEETVRKAMEDAAGRNIFRKFDQNHNMDVVDGVTMVESFILTGKDERFPDAAKGSWVGVLKFDQSKELWQRVKDGRFNGVSIFGKAAYDDENSAETVKELIDNLKQVKKALEEAGNKEAATAVQTKINEIEKSNNSDISEIVKSIKSLESTLTKTLEKAFSMSIKTEGGAPVIVKKSFGGVQYDYNEKLVEIYKSFANIYSGDNMNMLADNLGNQFMDATLEDPNDDTLSDITVAPLGRDNKIDKGLINDIILTNTADGTAPEDAHSHGDLEISPQVLKADISLSEDTAEEYRDSMGVNEFGAYMEKKITNGVKTAVKKLLFKGDRTGATAVKAMNGVIKLATANDDITEIDGADVLARIDNALRTFSENMLVNMENFVIYLTPADWLALSQLRDKDRTDQGRLVKEKGKMWLDGIPVKKRYMTAGYMIIGLAKFICLGYIRDARLKIEHKGSDSKFHWYPRIRAGVNYVPGGFVKVFKFVANKAPVASNVEILQDGLNTGDELVGSYDYSDSYGDVEGASTFRWLSSATANGTYAAIAGATSDKFEITADQATKYIKFEVTPKDENGNAGAAVLSSAVGACTNE